MEIQSLSIAVPAGCPNKCRFCCAEMHRKDYVNQIEKNKAFKGLYKEDYKRRLAFARDNGCNTVVLTGDGEPLFNKNFLESFSDWNESIERPFRWIELQTSGVNVNEETLRWLRNDIKVSTISLSLSSIFDSGKNAEYNDTHGKEVDIEQITDLIKKYDFNLRLSLNLTDVYNDKTPEGIFTRAKAHGANQITFRVLYTNDSEPDLPQNDWIRKHAASEQKVKEIEEFITEKGHMLEVLSFGATRYSVGGISTVVDGDCMSTEAKTVLRYMILRPDCKLYSKWDDKGSLIF